MLGVTINYETYAKSFLEIAEVPPLQLDDAMIELLIKQILNQRIAVKRYSPNCHLHYKKQKGTTAYWMLGFGES